MIELEYKMNELIKLIPKIESMTTSLEFLRTSIDDIYPDAQYDDIIMFAAHKIIQLDNELKCIKYMVENK
jgi:hypothetical protein